MGHHRLNFFDNLLLEIIFKNSHAIDSVFNPSRTDKTCTVVVRRAHDKPYGRTGHCSSQAQDGEQVVEPPNLS